MPNLRKIEAAVPAIREKKKVAAYARVSMQSERMLHSLSAQVSYYSGLIQKNPDWEYAGVYADDFISGTNTVKMGCSCCVFSNSSPFTIFSTFLCE